ncbi:hypothetical protein FOMPIDRAFT_1020859, partial [Fomitopsis schrenkii]
GEDFATWLKDNVEEFSGSLDHAAFAAKELTEKHNLLRRVGEFGNDYENANDAFYQFRTKAFELGVAHGPVENAGSPIQKSLSPMAEAVAARTTTFASLVSKALNANGNTEPPHIRSRREADSADRDYRIAVRKLDRQRLGLEERVEETLKTLQKWELDRLRAVKTVLRQYQTTVAKLAKAYEPSLERSDLLIDSYAPEVLIEQNRTGPFRPEPRVYESVTHDESDVGPTLPWLALRTPKTSDRKIERKHPVPDPRAATALNFLRDVSRATGSAARALHLPGREALAACLLRRAGPHVDRLRATGYLYVLAQAPRHDNACTLPCEPPVAGRRYVVSSKTGVASESRPSPPRDMLSGRSYVAVSEPHARTGGVQPCTVPASTACNELRGPVWTGYGILVGIPSAETSRPRSAATCHRCLKLARRLSGPYDDDFSPPSSCRRLRGIRRLSTASSLACQASGPGLPSSRYPP